MADRARTARVKRNTRETRIDLSVNLDKAAGTSIKTPIPFMNHMLELLAANGGFSLSVVAKGDVDVDDHHLVEDLGICLGQALAKALGDKKGIERYGFAVIPMDEVVVRTVLDLCGRARVKPGTFVSGKIKGFDVMLVKEFLEAFGQNAKMTLYMDFIDGADGNLHHTVEARFKALGRALRQAMRIDPKVRGVPSTKGRL